MKKSFLISGMFVLFCIAACQAQTPTPIALVATKISTVVAIASPTLTATPTSTHTPSKTAKPTNTLRPRQRTQTAVKTITPPTEAATATRAPTYTPLPIPLRNSWSSNVKQLLPAPLYYLSGVNEHYQIWRIETDGKTKRQITKLGTEVRDFDISPITGELAYSTANGIFIADALGNNPKRISIPGLKIDPRWDWEFFRGLAWSPIEKRLAFGYKGKLLIYDPELSSFQVIESPSNEYGLWGPFDDAWSPDGKQMLVEIAYEGDSGGVLLMTAESKPNFQKVYVSRCGEASWSHAGKFIYSSIAQTFQCFGPGLWRADRNSNKGLHLIDPQFPGTLQRVTKAQEGSDGMLYYFYASIDEPPDHHFVPDFRMYRSSLDGITNRERLRSDTHQVHEALWSPDMSLAVIVDARVQDQYKYPPFGARKLLLLTTDNKPPIELEEYGFHLRWGKN